MKKKYLSLLLSGAALVIIIAVHLLGYRQSQFLTKSFHSVEESQQTLIKIHRLSSYFKDIELAHSGYVITHEEEFLTPYENAVDIVPGLINDIADDIHTEQRQQALIDSLSAKAREKIDYVENAITQVNTGLYKEAAEGAAKGKKLFDQMMALMVKIENNELSYIAALQEKSRQIAKLHDAIFFIGSAISITLLLIAAVLVIKGQHKIEKLSASLHETNNDINAHNQRMEEANIALQKVTDELNSFSYSISHDLRAPLRAITGFCTIMMEEYSEQLDGNARRALTTIQQNTKRMEDLISDLLELSRVSAVAPNKQHFSMKQIVEQVLHDKASGDLKNKVRVLPMEETIADPGLLRQVWENLISNAIKFSSKNDDRFIEVGFKPLNGEQLYWVKDNGVGFDPAYTDKLFKVFSRLHGKKEFEGTGAGLAISKKIIEAHGGRMWAEAELSKGATFYFTLPLNNGIK